ncbi:unnamed protein product [Symbiodinium sp. CCMP2592]|nr:unnamed protein product [Symbiodinium sp. CCMP2592]
MDLACQNATEEPSEANLVRLLDLWSADWKHQVRTRVVGPGAFEKYCTLGFFGHGGVCGVSNATSKRAACTAVNRFLKSRFPNGTWTSIAVLFNPRMGLHRDIQNMPGHLNLSLALGASVDRRRRGWLDMHDKPVSFNARRYHMVEPHQGSMWALAAYVQHREALREAGFPLPSGRGWRRARQARQARQLRQDSK